MLNVSNSPGLVSADAPNPLEWRGHVIVCGLQTLGFRIIEQLGAAGVSVVGVDERPNSRLLEQSARPNLIIIRQDSRSPATLVQAGIRTASAVIACEDNDLDNLEIVLVAQELVEGIRVVANFADQQLGEQVMQTVGNGRALSLPEKAAPSFVEACLSSNVLDFFQAQGQEMAVVEIPAPTGTISNAPPLDGSVTPLFTLKHNGQSAPCVVLVGTVQDLQKLPGVALAERDLFAKLARRKSQEVPPVGAGDRTPLRHFLIRLRAILGDLSSRTERPFHYALFFLFIVTVFSTLLLWRFYTSTYTDSNGNAQPFTVLDALYFTITVVTSVGFGDYNFAQQSAGLKVYGIFLILIGVASTSVLYAFVANFIITRRLERTLGRYRATELEDHVVICGLGTLGYEVLRGLLKQGKQLVVVEKNEQNEFNQEVKRLGVPLIYGDARRPEVLRTANVNKASAIVVATSNDLINLKVALSAMAEFKRHAANRDKRLNLVLRMFDNSLAERVAGTFDIHSAYSASALAAPYFVGAALDYNVISTFYIERQPFIVAELVVQENSRLAGTSIARLCEATHGWLLLHTRRAESGQAFSRPDPGLLLQAGDTICFIGAPDSLLAAYQLNKIV